MSRMTDNSAATYHPYPLLGTQYTFPSGNNGRKTKFEVKDEITWSEALAPFLPCIKKRRHTHVDTIERAYLEQQRQRHRQGVHDHPHSLTNFLRRLRSRTENRQAAVNARGSTPSAPRLAASVEQTEPNSAATSAGPSANVSEEAPARPEDARMRWRNELPDAIAQQDRFGKRRHGRMPTLDEEVTVMSASASSASPRSSPRSSVEPEAAISIDPARTPSPIGTIDTVEAKKRARRMKSKSSMSMKATKLKDNASKKSKALKESEEGKGPLHVIHLAGHRMYKGILNFTSAVIAHFPGQGHGKDMNDELELTRVMTMTSTRPATPATPGTPFHGDEMFGGRGPMSRGPSDDEAGGKTSVEQRPTAHV